MGMYLDIIKMSKVVNGTIDYHNIVFKVNAADVFDLGESENMWILLKTIINGGGQFIIINMDKLDFIDSSGIGILINAAKLLRSKKGDLILLNVSSRIISIFNPIKLQRFIKIFQTDEEGLKYFQFL